MKRIPAELHDSDRVSIDQVMAERDALRAFTTDLLQERAELFTAGVRATNSLARERRDHHVTSLIAEAQRNRLRALRTALETYLLLLASVAAVTCAYAFEAGSFDAWAVFFVALYGTASGGFLFFKTRPRPPRPIEE